MIPDDWTPHRRDDGELLGWIRPASADVGADHWIAVDLLGRAASDALDWLDAEAVLDARGLSWLAEIWMLERPDAEPLRVKLVEVSPPRRRRRGTRRDPDRRLRGDRRAGGALRAAVAGARDAAAAARRRVRRVALGVSPSQSVNPRDDSRVPRLTGGMTIYDKARRLLDLHEAPELLTVVNVWDPISAKVVAGEPGTQALATASHSIAASFGYEDGEQIPLDLHLDAIQRIVQATDLPVSADLEAGYGDIGETIRRAINVGVVGANIEDQLKPLDEAVRGVEAALAAGESEGIRFVLNARTDAFVRGRDRTPEENLADAVTRGQAYIEAGAPVVFVPGKLDEAQIRTLVEAFGPRKLSVIGAGAPSAREARGTRRHARLVRPGAAAGRAHCAAGPRARHSRRGRHPGRHSRPELTHRSLSLSKGPMRDAGRFDRLSDRLGSATAGSGRA